MACLRRYCEKLRGPARQDLQDWRGGGRVSSGSGGAGGRSRHAIALATVILLLAPAAPSMAQQAPDPPPSEPILRINTVAHVALIRRSATDRDNRYLVTVSDDKTARLWSLVDNRLLAVLRVPIG